MYWDIEASIERLKQRLGPLEIKKQPTSGDILVFHFGPGVKMPYRLVFNTVFAGFGDARQTDTVITRVIMCRNSDEAKEIAAAMLGEEVYAREYLKEIEEISAL